MDNNNLQVAVTPDTDIYLLSLPFEMDEENELTFANITAQQNYFNGIQNKLYLENATYQRKDNVLRYPGNFEDLVSYNYCMYRNTNYGSKWFYAFIEDMKYINNNMTEIKLKTDVWQTWFSEITYKKRFVVREHVNDDTVGKHTLPENLELGEYVSNKEKEKILSNKSGKMLVMAVSDLPQDSMTFGKGNYTGLYSGLYYLGFLSSGTGITNINNVILMYAKGSRLSAIQSIFYVDKLANSYNVATWTMTSGGDTITADVAIIPNTDTAFEGTNVTLTKPTKLGNNYTPVNNKLKTYPYMFFNLSNNAGMMVPFRYEDFTSSITFKPVTALAVGSTTKLIPLNYKHVAENYAEGLEAGKLPQCSWTGDAYINWLTQASVNIGGELLALGTYTGIAVASGGEFGIEGGVSTLGTIADFMVKKENNKIIPDQVRGEMNAGDINFAYDYNGFTVYYQSIKDEYAKCIDDYFSAYGYQVNSYKLPNITGRANWNYVKCGSCNITGNIPQKDLEELKRIFIKGVTFWHNASTFLDYSQSNGIVS